MAYSTKFSSILAGLFIAGSASVSQAAPLDPFVDEYWGGDDSGMGYNSDVKGNPAFFDIQSAVVEKIGFALKIIINTNYSDINGTTTNVGKYNTNLGSLFLGDPTKLDYNNTGGGGTNNAPKYDNDQFTADTDRFGYAFDFDVDPVPGNVGNGGTATLYDLNELGTDVIKSNVPGDLAGNSIRRNQAVGTTSTTATGITGTWQVGVGTVTFNLANFFDPSNFGPGKIPEIYKTAFTLAWAMTCANDVILASVVIPRDSIVVTPVPAGLLLFFSGLTGLGFLGRFRSRATKAAA
jgi:hypothetical protein